MDDVGGLVGVNETEGIIIDCYSNGYVSGSDRVGGLVGDNGRDSGVSAEIINSYSNSYVIGENQVGGLLGRNEILSNVVG